MGQQRRLASPGGLAPGWERMSRAEGRSNTEAARQPTAARTDVWYTAPGLGGVGAQSSYDAGVRAGDGDSLRVVRSGSAAKAARRCRDGQVGSGGLAPSSEDAIDHPEPRVAVTAAASTDVVAAQRWEEEGEGSESGGGSDDSHCDGECVDDFPHSHQKEDLRFKMDDFPSIYGGSQASFRWQHD